MSKINLMINRWKQEADELDTMLSNSYKHIERAAIAGNVIRLRQCIIEVELLLKHDESKQPQPPDFANTMLGEVPHEVSVENQESQQAVEGATPVVRQNEQTKKKQKLIDEAWDDLGDTLYQMGNEEPEF